MEKRINKDTDVYYNLELILTEIRSKNSMTDAAFEELSKCIYAYLETLEKPDVIHSLDVITFVSKQDKGADRYTSQFINFIKSDNGSWILETGESLSFVEFTLKHTETKSISYYINQDGLLAKNVAIIEDVEHCYVEREHGDVTVYHFEDNAWAEQFSYRYPQRGGIFNNLVKHTAPRENIRVRGKGA